MILGVLSDSHGRARRVRRAVARLRDAGAAAFIHCGDVGGEDVLDELAGLRAWLVWGNTDAPGASLVQYARSLGVTVADAPPLRVELEGRLILVFHGHEVSYARCMQCLEAPAMDDRRPATLVQAFGPVDYVMHGHTHVARDERFGSVRVINPGALTRARPRSVAALDLTRDTLTTLVVDDA
jgi:putative phosphoesterase